MSITATGWGARSCASPPHVTGRPATSTPSRSLPRWRPRSRRTAIAAGSNPERLAAISTRSPRALDEDVEEGGLRERQRLLPAIGHADLPGGISKWERDNPEVGRERVAAGLRVGQEPDRV